MIQIDDNDLPITVAEKIIKGTKPNKYSTDGWKALSKAVTGIECDTIDMFNLEEIKEIASYLRVYCECHEEGD